MDEQTVIGRVQQAMLTDDEDREKQSQYLADCYNEASEEAKQRIDDCCRRARCAKRRALLVQSSPGVRKYCKSFH